MTLIIAGHQVENKSNVSEKFSKVLSSRSLERGTIFKILTKDGVKFFQKFTTKYAMCLMTRRLYHFNHTQNCFVSNKEDGNGTLKILGYGIQKAKLHFID